MLSQMMQAGDSFIPFMPLLIYQVAQDNFELFDEISDELGSDGGAVRFQDGDEDRSDSEGMYNSVICREEYILADIDQAEAQVLTKAPEALQPALFSSTIELFEVCQVWGSGEPAPFEKAAAVSNIPTLILVGEYDLATPSKWGRLAAETLSHSYYFEFPGSGHSLLSDVECAIQITGEFLNNPAVEPNRNCLRQMGPPLFELP